MKTTSIIVTALLLIVIDNCTAIRGHGGRRATIRVGSPKLTEEELDAMKQLRRRAEASSGKGKGGKGKGSWDGEVLSGDWDEMDGSALDSLGTATDDDGCDDDGITTDGTTLENGGDPVNDLGGGSDGSATDTTAGDGVNGGATDTTGDGDDDSKGPGYGGGRPKDKDPDATEADGGWTGGGDGTGLGGTDGSDGTALDGTDPVAGDSNGVSAEPGVVFGGEGMDTLSEDAGDDPSITLAQCKVTDPDIGDLENLDLANKPIQYFYTVSTNGKATLDEILGWVEFKVLKALVESNQVLACSSVRRLQDVIGDDDGLSGLRITSYPPDEPEDDCAVCNDVPVRGELSVGVPEGADLDSVECDVLPVLNEAMMAMDGIEGLVHLRYEALPMPARCGPTTSTSNGSPSDKKVVGSSATQSEQVPAGVLVGAALGGMCLVLLGLLVVRQRVLKNRTNGSGGTVMTKETKPIDDSALEMTVDANTTQNTTRYLTPKATQSSDSSTVLGISASPDDCSEWGDGRGPSKIDDDEDDVESRRPVITAKDKLDPNSSDEQPSQVSPLSQGSLDPPSYDAEQQDVSFEPNVHEESSLMHNVVEEEEESFMDDDVEQRDAPFEPNVHEESSLMHNVMDEDEESFMNDDAEQREAPFERNVHEESVMYVEDDVDIIPEPKVHEESSLMHDVDIMPDDESLRSGLAEA